MIPFWKKKYQKKSNKTKFIVKNGEVLLEKLITTFNGKRNPISNFTSQELNLATKRYDTTNVVLNDSLSTLYRANLSDRQISVMKFDSSLMIARMYCINYMVFEEAHKYCINNIVFAAQMRHKNILQLLGCCLETEVPILVFQYVECGTLAERLHCHDQPNIEPLLWMQRLKIAMEIAYAVAYLHVGFPRPIVFRNIKSDNILFDEEGVAKLFDFSFAILIPEDETYVKDLVMGTFEYMAPEYFLTGCCDERCDVFSFGALLLELLSGRKIFDLLRSNDFGLERFSCDFVKKLMEQNKMKEITDPIILEDIQCPEKEQQLQAFAKLGAKCYFESPEDRPTMVDVAKQIRELYHSCISR